jgi:carboxylesterase
MPAALIAFLLVVVAIALRFGVKQRIERASAARHTRGPTGIVRGAEPIDLPGAGPGAVLLLHGFNDTPQSLVPLAAELQERGWTVRVPLLPGHGRTLRDFARSRAQDWIGAARQELAELRVQHDAVAVAGLSMGGALATILAAETRDLVAVVLLAPYLAVPLWIRLAARAHPLIDAVMPYVSGGESRSIDDPVARSRSLAYDAATARLVWELTTLVRVAQAALPRVTAPALIIQSPSDNRVPPEVAERAFARLGSRERRLVWTTRGRHVITVDDGATEVASTAAEWLDDHLAKYHTHGVATHERQAGPEAG